ncbi:hypothetical protein GMDG_03393 [Pseudogymnoascus destructans 20631-21]|uniref:Uncharacterized protein n=1 Tax=Pseudogymnoascus destructans (strain ATCC MYA-4855 / 20631-21) TaxID=658429 RepID=L8G9K3_PSED2|nr:hypothetical protein GMDG_03393 [Pseudogymnoascus destructans 20631-21]
MAVRLYHRMRYSAIVRTASKLQGTDEMMEWGHRAISLPYPCHISRDKTSSSPPRGAKPRRFESLSASKDLTLPRTEHVFLLAARTNPIPVGSCTFCNPHMESRSHSHGSPRSRNHIRETRQRARRRRTHRNVKMRLQLPACRSVVGAGCK